jgi:hypothetical protein
MLTCRCRHEKLGQATFDWRKWGGGYQVAALRFFRVFLNHVTASARQPGPCGRPRRFSLRSLPWRRPSRSPTSGLPVRTGRRTMDRQAQSGLPSSGKRCPCRPCPAVIERLKGPYSAGISHRLGPLPFDEMAQLITRRSQRADGMALGEIRPKTSHLLVRQPKISYRQAPARMSES